MKSSLFKPPPILSLIPAILLPITGCVSSTLPRALSTPESQRWKGAHFPEIVAVEPFKFPAYSDALLPALRGTHLFADVEPLDDCPKPPTLIARVEQETNGGVATTPIWTFLTLGIVPTVNHEYFGYHFSLRRPHGAQPPAIVNYEFESTTTLGWLALFQAASPNVGLGDPDKSDRYRGRLALAILDSTHP